MKENLVNDSASNTSKLRGFARMDPARHREIASRGGCAARANGTAHKYTSDTGRAAAKKRWNRSA